MTLRLAAVLLAAFGLALTAPGADAQREREPTPSERPADRMPEVLPPPGIDEQGVDPETAEAAAAAEAAEAELPPKVQPTGGDEVPDVVIRTDAESGDRIEEYRQGGQIYMVRVTPKRGAPYTLLDTNGDGRLDAKDGEGPVRPVYWTIYEWD